MYRLTIPQKNIWNLRKYYPGTGITNICGSVLFREKMELSLLESAIQWTVKSQGGLRLRFVETKDGPMQEEMEFAPITIDYKYFGSMEELRIYAEGVAQTPISLDNGYLCSFTLFELEERTGILFCTDHLISDAWTFSLIAKQVYTAYCTMKEGEPGEYQEYSYQTAVTSEEKYLSSKAFGRDQAYWAEEYDNFSGTAEIKPETGLHDNPAAKRLTTVIEPKLSKKISRFESETGYSPAVLFEAAATIYLSRINNDATSISLGLAVLNRSNYVEKKTAGMFISTVPMRIDYHGAMKVSEMLEALATKHMRIFRHQRYPYSEIISEVRKLRPGTNALYDVIVSYQNAVTEIPADTYWYFNGFCEIPLEMHIDKRDGSDTYTLNMDYQTAKFSNKEAELLRNRILHIILQIISRSETSIDDISIIPSEEEKMLLLDFNDTAVAYPKEKCVHELFGLQAKKTPDQIALVFEDRRFSYSELDKMSNALARYLRVMGVKRGDIVPIIAYRSWHVIVAMIGVLKAGAAYMPVDPTYPVERIKEMISIAQAEIVLTYRYSDTIDALCISLDEFSFNISNEGLENINDVNDLCYVIFTSGSTGKPKGLSITHDNVANYHITCKNVMNMRCRSILSSTNIIFDMFVTESLMPLINGTTIFLTNDDQMFLQDKISEVVKNGEIDILLTTPTKMRIFISNKSKVDYLRNLKLFILGGEELTQDLTKELLMYSNATILNTYGPAETTVWASYQEVISAEEITIGKPIANTQIYILDNNHKLLPIGVAGELCIAGDGVGKGYLNRPDLTAERFIPNPFATTENGHGPIMYRTGDLARWREDGEIEYLGRIDTQVKIRGLRIELSEIESVLASYPGMQLVAVADKKDGNGRQYLVGYYTADQNADEKELRKHLGKTLPKYMIPNYFMHLDEMPMTASGKTDRKNLPVPEFSFVERLYVAPTNENEEILCSVLEELLQFDQIGIADDFFELGGDSLKAIEYVAQAHNHGIDFDLQSVFDYPTIQSLWNHIVDGDKENFQYSVEEFEKYMPLLSKNVIDEQWDPKKKDLGTVLVTGATGFLGAHVIDTFLRNESGKVYCLVRGSEERLNDTLRYYFGNQYDTLVGERIICIVGDINDDNLEKILPDDIQTIIHTAATVKHYGSYSYFERVNVHGTARIADCALKRGARMIHISTVSVSGNSFADAFDISQGEQTINYDEMSLYRGQPLGNVYVRSKFEAERAVLGAMLKGLDAKIIRVGNLTNRASDYKFQPNYESNAFLTRLKAGLAFGVLPDYLKDEYTEFSPIDQTAEGILLIAKYADSQTVFHLNSNKGLYFTKMTDILHELGIRMDIIEGTVFNKKLQELVKSTATEYIYEAFQNDLDANGNLAYDGNIHIVNDFTVWFLKKLGFEWIDIDQKYVTGYINYFRNLGYLDN